VLVHHSSILGTWHALTNRNCELIKPRAAQIVGMKTTGWRI
jgi:hypothetical protein